MQSACLRSAARATFAATFFATASLFAAPSAPVFVSPQPAPVFLYPDAPNGPCKVIVDYTDSAGASALQHAYLRVKGAGADQTILYHNLTTPVQWSREGDHLQNLSATKTAITNGYRVTYEFTIGAGWPATNDVDLSAWAMDTSNANGPSTDHDWNRVHDGGFKITASRLAGLVDADGDGWYSFATVEANVDSALSTSRQAALALYRRPTGTTNTAFVAFSSPLFSITGSAVDWNGFTVAGTGMGVFDFAFELYDGAYDYNESQWFSNPAICGVRFESAADDAYRQIEFAGLDWYVRTTYGNPGGNAWNNNSSSVWVDEAGLHLTVKKDAKGWYCTEVSALEPLGYGLYTFKLIGRTDLLDKNVVLGIFLYEDDSQEIDIEFGRWGNASADSSQYVVQPFATPGNLHRFDFAQSGTYTTHTILWEPTKITFRSYHGHGTNSANLINEWVYTGDDNPVADDELLILNLWLIEGASAPSDEQEVEFIVHDVEFTPLP